MVRNVLVLVHLLAVIVWIGGMFFAHFCLRPVAAAQLQPPQRLPLLAAVLGIFFKFVGIALLVLWGSGLIRFAQAGAAIPAHWHAMAGLALLMTLIFAVIVLRYFRRMRAALEIGDLPSAGRAMNAIRSLVLTNLVLGLITVTVAVAG
jgi:uncharacterized membrane protein